MLSYLRENVPATRSLDDDTILKAYTEIASKKDSKVRYPDNLVAGYEDSPDGSGAARRRAWERVSGIR